MQDNDHGERKVWKAFTGPHSDETPNREPLEVLGEALSGKGSECWNAWRTANTSAIVNLSPVKLREANLDNYDLSSARLYQADLQGARFWKANLDGADITEAYMRGEEALPLELLSTASQGFILLSTGVSPLLHIMRGDKL